MRTIEADRAARGVDADLRAAEREAEWQQELRRAAAQNSHEIARFETMNAVDDSAKLALAPHANAALLAEVMKTRVHAGMSAEQLGALAQVAGAGQLTPLEAQGLAQQQLEAERARRELEVDKDRRHQLDLLALQNDVNKTALASQARLGAGVAAALAGACRHEGAGQADRYCGSCGATLPARG